MSEFNFDGLGIEEQFRKTAIATEKAIEKAIETAKENGTSTEALKS
jgi:hypothetical protein